MASNFPGLKDPRKQSRLGRLADRDVELGHAREWSRERLAAARRAEDDAAKYKAATRRDIAGVTESTGLGRSPSDALRENLEKALVKPSLLGMTAPLALSVPTTTAGKVIGGGIGAALGGIGGEDPYFSALSMLHPTLAMAQMVNVAYSDEPILPIPDAQGAGFPRRLIDLPGPARTARRYTPDERVAMLNELAPYARPKKLDPKASNILTNVLDDASKMNDTTVLYDQFNKPISMYSMAGRGEPFDDSEYLSGLVSLNGPRGTGRQAAQHAARNTSLEGFRLFNTPTSKGFWDRIIETEPDWSLQYMPEHGLSAYRYLPPIKFAGGGSVAGAAKRFAQRAMSQAGDVDPVVAPRGALSVVKNKGGNWLTGSVEGSLNGVKRTYVEESEIPALHEALRKAGVEERFFNARDPETGMDMLVDHPLYDQTTLNFIANRPINTWIDKQLTRYVKNEMATPEDPIRALAERGVLHFDPNEVAQARRTVHPSGEVPRTMGESPLARAWEQTSDNFIAPETAGRFKVTLGQDGTTTVSRNPWLEKLPNDAIVHDVYESSRPSQLGFDHLIDELSNALNPESGLPRHLLLDPKSMSRVSVPQAVERVSAINAWRAEQARIADLEKMKANLTQKPYKEYQGGWRWAELPDADTPEGVKLVNDIGCQGGWCTQGESAAKSYGSHKGGNKLYALIDAEGRPHVQVQTKTHGQNLGEQDIPDRYIEDAMERLGIDTPEAQWGREEEIDALAGKLWKEANPDAPPRVLQIKPFSNSWESQMVRDFTAKNPKYKEKLLPMIQDFVKSGQWSDVGDLHNTGLRDIGQSKINSKPYNDLAEEMFPGLRYLTDEEAEKLQQEGIARTLKERGYAQGGLVEAMIEQNLDALVEKQTPKQMSRGGSVRAPIRVKIEKMTSELRQCRN